MSAAKLFCLIFSLTYLFLLCAEKQVYGQDFSDCLPNGDCSDNNSMAYCDGQEPWERPFRWYIDHIEGNWLDIREGYTSLGLLLAFPNLKVYSILPFLDARIHLFNRGKIAGNFGAGLRYIDQDNFRVYGIHAFYDYRQTSLKAWFQQVGIGFEMLNSCWDFRLNGYFPIKGEWKHSKKHVFDNFMGDFHATCQERLSGLCGADVELGFWLKKKKRCDFFDLYGAIGSYYYSHKGHKNNNAIGCEIRLATNIGRYLNLEAKAGYDRIYHGIAQGKITLTFPFDVWGIGCGYASGCIDEIAYQPVRRQDIVVLSQKECCWTWNWDTSCQGCQH